MDHRIKMTAWYAVLEGGLSASAYTAAIVATLGTLGGGNPATVPAAVVTLMVDVAFVTRLQLRLPYDISVPYRVPLDTSDHEDLWKLIRVAFAIRGGEFVREGVVKAVPPLVRHRWDIRPPRRGRELSARSLWTPTWPVGDTTLIPRAPGHSRV